MKPLQERAAQAIRMQHNVPSPCISLCQMRESDGLCAACWRTLDEISHWSRMSDAQKRQIWGELTLRSILHINGVNA